MTRTKRTDCFSDCKRDELGYCIEEFCPYEDGEVVEDVTIRKKYFKSKKRSSIENRKNREC